MIEKLKSTPTKISLYDLIFTSQAHREVLYALFKKEVIPNDISIAIFFEKIKPLEECDAILFYKYEKLKKEILHECLALYIIPMINGWEIERTSVSNGSIVKVCSNNFLAQLKEKDVQIPPLYETTF